LTLFAFALTSALLAAHFLAAAAASIFSFSSASLKAAKSSFFEIFPFGRFPAPSAYSFTALLKDSCCKAARFSAIAKGFIFAISFMLLRGLLL
jgi:hypothetical protein